jgi:proton glutamate symport protein
MLFQRIKTTLQHPASIFLAAALGACVGIYAPEYGIHFAPWGHMFLASIQMTVIPFVVVSISSSIAKVISAKHSAASVNRIFMIFMALLFLESAIGIIAGEVLQPGVMEPQEVAQIMEKAGGISIREVSIDAPIDTSSTKDFVLFLSDIIPSNIFNAFSEGHMLQIVLFTIIFGIALGLMPGIARDQIVSFFDVIQHTFLAIIDGICIFLPLGVFFLFADQIAKLNVTTLTVMLRFVLMSIGTIIFLLFLSSLIIWRRSGTTYLKSLSALRYPILIALSTSDSLVAMPLAINMMVTRLGFNPSITSLVLPLGIATSRYGYVAYFAFSSIFIAQLYATPLGVMDYTIILVGAVLVGLKSSGAPGLLTIPMMSLILDPLGLPLGGAITLFMAVDLIADPFRTVGVVYTNCAAASLIAERPDPNKPQTI